MNDWEYTTEMIDIDYDQFRLPKDVIKTILKVINGKLRAERAKCPVVYLNFSLVRDLRGPWIGIGPFPSDTHQARLDGVIERRRITAGPSGKPESDP